MLRDMASLALLERQLALFAGWSWMTNFWRIG
jgi:hypothetical protein